MNTEKPSVAHNVDHNEIAKFEAVASRWWDLEGEFKPLHRINPYALATLLSAQAACLVKGARRRLRRRYSGGEHGARRRNRHRAGYGL